jgi:hypothetical protein
MRATFASLFPSVDDFLALELEDAAAVVFEVMPSLMQNGLVNATSLIESPFQAVPSSYPPGRRTEFARAVAECLSWLESQGLIMADPEQPARWYRFTRKGLRTEGRMGVAQYRVGRSIPFDLLPEILVQKVRPIFIRGDYDTAVFQAFREVEVRVRKAANAKGAGYSDDLVGVNLMRSAFHPDSGVLRDKSLVKGEREAMAALFAAAIGHARNSTGHRDVGLSPERAARLVLFAAHLLDVVDEREADAS